MQIILFRVEYPLTQFSESLNKKKEKRVPVYSQVYSDSDSENKKNYLSEDLFKTNDYVVSWKQQIFQNYIAVVLSRESDCNEYSVKF